MTKPNSPLIPDAPILSRKDDLFGRAKFAENLAKSIAGVPAEDGFVFALNATWGSGKTSTLNMIREALQEDAKTDGKQFITVQFNPWWFSGGNFLVQDFFRQFQGALIEQGGSEKKHGDAIRKLAGKIRTFSSVLTPFPVFGEWAKLVGDMSEGVERLFSNPADDIRGVRKEICDSLREMSDLRVLVVMDDLDRIQPNEICEMFRLIKGVADFPNTIYLLPFDRKAVAAAVAHKSFHSDEAAAGEYLEKIIQAPLDLPPIHKRDIIEYFLPKFLEIAGISCSEWEQRTLKDPKKIDLFRRNPVGGEDTGIVYGFLNTVRDAKRWLNSIIASYPLVRGKIVRDEIDVVDFIALQGLRVFAPSVYRDVWGKKELFVPVSPLRYDHSNSTEKEAVSDLVKRANDLRNSMNDNKNPRIQIAQDILQRLFPYWADLTEDTSNDKTGGKETEKISGIVGTWTSSYYPENCVGSKASFDNYFIFPPANAPAPSAEPRRNS